MTRIKSTEWALREAIKKRKSCIAKKYPLFVYKECSVCQDALRREWIWQVDLGREYKHKYVCMRCAGKWEEAYDKARDPQNAGMSYTHSY